MIGLLQHQLLSSAWAVLRPELGTCRSRDNLGMPAASYYPATVGRDVGEDCDHFDESLIGTTTTLIGDRLATTWQLSSAHDSTQCIIDDSSAPLGSGGSVFVRNVDQVTLEGFSIATTATSGVHAARGGSSVLSHRLAKRTHFSLLASWIALGAAHERSLRLNSPLSQQASEEQLLLGACQVAPGRNNLHQLVVPNGPAGLAFKR